MDDLTPTPEAQPSLKGLQALMLGGLVVVVLGLTTVSYQQGWLDPLLTFLDRSDTPPPLSDEEVIIARQNLPIESDPFDVVPDRPDDYEEAVGIYTLDTSGDEPVFVPKDVPLPEPIGQVAVSDEPTVNPPALAPPPPEYSTTNEEAIGTQSVSSPLDNGPTEEFTAEGIVTDMDRVNQVLLLEVGSDLMMAFYDQSTRFTVNGQPMAPSALATTDIVTFSGVRAPGGLEVRLTDVTVTGVYDPIGIMGAL